MQYKTIVLQQIEQMPELHEQLRTERRLLQAVNEYAMNLKSRHNFWIDQLTKSRPPADPVLISNEAMELAINEFHGSLPQPFSPSDNLETCRLDAAMAYLRRSTETD